MKSPENDEQRVGMNSKCTLMQTSTTYADHFTIRIYKHNRKLVVANQNISFIQLQLNSKAH